MVRWTVRRVRDRLHAVADVPLDVPPAALALSTRANAVSLVHEDRQGTAWTASLPRRVEPTPLSVSYNNGIVEVVFALEEADTVIERRE